jgi:hypothetical protein
LPAEGVHSSFQEYRYNIRKRMFAIGRDVCWGEWNTLGFSFVPKLGSESKKAAPGYFSL